MPSIKTLKLQNPETLTPLERILLLRWRPMNAPKGMNLWGLYIGPGRNYPAEIYTCPRTHQKTHIKSSAGKPNLLEAQQLYYELTYPQPVHNPSSDDNVAA